MQPQTKSRRWEGLAFWGIMTGILLPIRYLVSTELGNNWFGSLGVLTGVSLTILYLARKGKLGWLGTLFQRQMGKLYNSKRKKIVFGFMIFNTLLISLVLGSILYGETPEVQKRMGELLTIMNEKHYGITVNDIISQSQNMDGMQWARGIYATFFLLIFDFKTFSALMAIMDSTFHHMYERLTMIMLIEQAEILGVFLLYRRIFTIPKEVKV